MLNSEFVFDGKEFNSQASFALHLKNNYRKALNFINDETLYHILQSQMPEVYEKVVELSKDFLHKENILTLIIYLLDSNLGIVTSRYQFINSNDIANEMKKTYPSINPDIKVLFSDKVLAHIFWDEYQKTNDAKFKRNYTFMLHVYENKQYEFTYFYYLYLHLYKNEVVRFTLDGYKMKSLREITIHISNNLDRALEIMDEVVHNPYIMALMAVESGIEQVSMVLGSKNKLEILKLLSSYEPFDFTILIRQKMSYWLLLNFNNYEYKTEEALSLRSEYEKLLSSINLNTLSDYIMIYDEVNALYDRFLKLFNNNKYLTYKTGIEGSEDYYINYRHNDEYVCKQFLVENDLFDYMIHTEIHCDSIERELIVNELNVEKKALNDFREEVLNVTKGIEFDKKQLNAKRFISTMYILLLSFSIFVGLMLGVKKDNEIDQWIVNGLFASSCLAFLLLIFAHSKYENRLRKFELIDIAKENSLHAIDEIISEEEKILNPANETFSSVALVKRDVFAKNRKKDLVKIKKYAKTRVNVCPIWIILGTTLAILPIFEFGLKTVLLAFEQTMVKLVIEGIDLSLFTVGVAALQLVLLLIFRKRNFIYYLIYIYMIAISVASILLF